MAAKNFCFGVLTCFSPTTPTTVSIEKEAKLAVVEKHMLLLLGIILLPKRKITPALKKMCAYKANRNNLLLHKKEISLEINLFIAFLETKFRLNFNPSKNNLETYNDKAPCTYCIAGR